jgi:small-conductance mechanosensitive channel
MDRSIKAGIFGFLLAVIINLSSVFYFLPIILDFVPSFLAAILAIYIFKLEALKDGLVAAFITYIFNEGILDTIGLAIYYSMNKPYPSFSIDISTVFSPIVTSLTAVIAGYIGVWLAQKRKPAQEPSPTLPPQLPPV